MGVGTNDPLGVGQADFADQGESLLPALPWRQQVMRLEHFGDLVADTH